MIVFMVQTGTSARFSKIVEYACLWVTQSEAQQSTQLQRRQILCRLIDSSPHLFRFTFAFLGPMSTMIFPSWFELFHNYPSLLSVQGFGHGEEGGVQV